MSKNLYKLSVFCFFIILSKFCFAVNLGEIEVISKSNQAFLANIELSSYTNSELDGLKIKLASNEEYEKFGIEKDLLLEELQFSLEAIENDRLYIQLHAGFLAKDFPNSFLLEVSWPDGQIIKQYDFSPIDDFDIEDSEEVEILHKQFQAAIDAVITSDNESSLDANLEIVQQIQRITNKQPKSLPLVEKITRTPSGGIEYSPVEDGESVSKIARLLTDDKKLSVNQVMVALFNENRDAFMDNNIHRLKKGVTLKIKSQNAMALVSKEEALHLAQQYMSNPGIPKDFKDSRMAENAFTEDVTKFNKEEQTKTIKHLEIISASEGLIPQDILKRIKAEELAKSEEEIRIANNKLQTLQSEIMFLKQRINRLENNTGFKEDSSLLGDVDLPADKKVEIGNSATVQNDNLMLVNTGLALEEKDGMSFMQNVENYKTSMLLASAAFLTISLLGFRHKTWLSTLTQRFS